MKVRVMVIGLVFLAGALVILSNVGVIGTSQKAEASAVALPASLEQYYPPKNPAPAYLLAMVDLGRSFSGMICDVLENDMENAQSNFEKFRKAYNEISFMIPEWKEKYPMSPIEQMRAALASGDPSKIMPAAESIGAACHNCHLTLMAPVQQKYRWGNFSDIILTDPLSGQDASFAQLMLMMETNFEGVANDLGQGQQEAALKQFEGFRARFQEMTNACDICHDTERYYFISKDITNMLSGLQSELSKPQCDTEIVSGYLQSIGQESCSKCHLVHIPAAYGQQAFKVH